MTAKPKELLNKVALVVFSISFMLLCLELFFRITLPIKFKSFINHATLVWTNPDTFLNDKVVRPSATLGYEWIPGSHAGWVQVNSLGMLGEERTRQKPKGVYRIICLGDSTIANANYSSAYVSLLEKLLNSNNSPRKFEVWNCGVAGYGAIQYCRALKEKWINYEPDMVIIGFCLNDFDTTPLLVKEKNNFVGYFPYKEILPKINPFLFRHSALYRFFINKLFFLKKEYSDNSPFKVAGSSLKEVKSLLSGKNIRLMIVILGLAERFNNYQLQWKSNYEEIKKIINDCNIESLDIVPIFENNSPESLKETAGDEIHFNLRGNQVIADAIYAYLQHNFKEIDN